MMAEGAAALDDAVPVGVHVSTTEAAMPTFYGVELASAFYPIDMDEADYLVIPGCGVRGQGRLVERCRTSSWDRTRRRRSTRVCWNEPLSAASDCGRNSVDGL